MTGRSWEITPLDRTRFGARAAACEALGRILRRHLVLEEALILDGLSARDRAFARLLTTGVLRRLGQIESLLALCLERPLPRSAAPVMDILRLGAFQLVFLGTAPHAAVDTAVEMTASSGFTGHKKLVNAVLRRLSREGGDLVRDMDAPRINTPGWLWRSWSAAYGEENCHAIAARHLVEPPLDLTVKGDPSLWAERLGAALLPTGSLRLEAAGAVPDLPGYGEGAWWVQDAAAALPARLIPDPGGKRIADLCAAPGGKTAQLLAAGASVTALDRQPERLERLAGNLDRVGLSARLIAADAAKWRPEEPFDAVLLDAPCSATGTLRRHPDIARLKTPAQVTRLGPAQDRLLASALAMLRPGGVLVYCTCSLEPEEGERRVESFLAGGAPARRLPVRADEVGGLAELVTERGELRSLPCHLPQKGGMDGFFAARLVKG